MIILHSHYSRKSRELVQVYQDTHTIISWYEGGRELWESFGGTMAVQSFPSVIVDMPEHYAPEATVGDVVGRYSGVNARLVPAQQLAMSFVTSSGVDANIAFCNQRLQISTDNGFPVSLIVKGDLYRVENQFKEWKAKEK